MINIKDIINKKMQKKELSKDEIDYVITEFSNCTGSVTENQMSSLLTAICINGMTENEIFYLTDSMLNSGEIINWDDDIKNLILDKHSTGGVGDKLTLILIPILACLGFKVAKMSGRALGYTGGTIDKLESISDIKLNLDQNEYVKALKTIGIAEGMQTNNLAPADKKIYMLRDEIMATNSIPLIASSIMSKKLALNPKYLILEITYGTGALIQTKEEADILKDIMVKIAKRKGVIVYAELVDMNNPLGQSIGNKLEVYEAMQILRNESNIYVKDMIVNLIYDFLKYIKRDESKENITEIINSGKAYKKFKEMLINQNVSEQTISELEQYKINTKEKIDIFSKKKGIIKKIDALKIAKICYMLGAGRNNKNEQIDYEVGIVLEKMVGDKINIQDKICTIYSNNKEKTKEAIKELDSTVVIK